MWPHRLYYAFWMTVYFRLLGTRHSSEWQYIFRELTLFQIFIALRFTAVFLKSFLLSPVQCFTVAIVGSLLENPVSRFVSRSLINIDRGNRGDCGSFSLVLFTNVWKFKKSEKRLLLKTFKQKFIFEISLIY